MQDHPDDVLVLEVSVALRALEPQPREKEAHFARELGERLGVKVEVKDHAGGG